ncbi:MAG: threonine aldolase [Urechidicola sp.]|jgi:threonine aldolase|tara:strand:+ start:632 stop:1654 length:1023 start_codon:yes stop_codon:yes gene_type:complete
MKINLISDTVTKPTPEMLEYMMNAEVGDDVFKQDPTVNALEERVAKLFGKQKALFFPSGSMANQAAIKLHTQPSDQVICDKFAHIYNYEAGGASFNSGVSCKLIDGDKGMFTAAQVKEAINPNAFYYSQTSLVAIENTTNKGGGACWDFNELKKIKEVCDEHKLGYHLDGARLWNALVAKQETAKQYGSLFDTISVCFSKGLGCPVGSMLIGDEAIMEHAIRVRKLFGGNMRQIGYLAAAADYALDNHIDRLVDDHKRAQQLGVALENSPLVKKVEPIETNIVIFNVADGVDENEFVNKLAEKYILLISMGEGKLRMVTHLDFTDAMLEKTLDEIRVLEV